MAAQMAFFFDKQAESEAKQAASEAKLLADIEKASKTCSIASVCTIS